MDRKSNDRNHNKPFLGLYEKAIPSDLSWGERLSLARKAGYNYMEIAIDESDERLERLKWDKIKKRKLREVMEDSGIPLLSMCLSANRRFPVGSSNKKTQQKGVKILEEAIIFASHLGIRVVQVAGYDVLEGEASTDRSREDFSVNLANSVRLASSLGVMLAVENVDIVFTESIHRIMHLIDKIKSPWLQVYPDFGNLAAMRQDVEHQLEIGKNHIAAIHVKDTVDGVVRGIPFGEGIVDFISVFNTLKKINFYGPMLIEMWADDKKDYFEVISHARVWVLEKIKQSSYLS